MRYPYVAWQTFHWQYVDGARRATHPQIWFATKKTGTWVTTLVYENDYTASAFGDYPYIGVANNGAEFLLTVSWSGANIQTAFRSMDEGESWVEVEDGEAWPWQRLFRCQGSWVGVGLYGVEFSDDGRTWNWHGDPSNLAMGDCQQNQIAVDVAGRIHLCTGSSWDSIAYAMTPDLGATWVESMPITLDPSYGLRYGCLTAYDNHVIVAAAVEGDIEYGVIANFSHDGGLTWDSEHGELALAYEYGTAFIGSDYEALGFYDGDLYLITNGWVNVPGVEDEYRVWAYRCTNWEAPGSHSWGLETIGTVHEGVCASTDPATGAGVFLESYNGFFRTDPYPATIWHNQLVETDPTGFMGHLVLQQRTPEPLTLFSPWDTSADHWLLTPMNYYAPPPNWYTEDSGGYSLWW